MNEIQRMQKLAGILNESVQSIPGLNEKSTSEKQARFMAAAAHNPEFAKKTGMDQSVAKEFNKADTGTEQLSKAMQHKTEESSAMGLEECSALDVKQACARFDGLIQEYPEDQALDIIENEFLERGYDEQETSRIMHAVEEELGITPFDHSAYDMLNPDYGDEDPIDEDMFNNGYDDEHYASGKDYFPTGADSSVTSAVGPSGARQGDNPEQKRMEVAETHKSLVSSYKAFLRESRK